MITNIDVIKYKIKQIAKRVIPARLIYWLMRPTRPAIGEVDFGSFRRLAPIDPSFGRFRGLAIDRYYIERFLSNNISDIRGCVLEMGDNAYTRKFGGNRIIRSDVLDVVEGNPNATVVADLTTAGNIPADTFDCIICTQTLQMIFDFQAALRHLYRILKPGGVLLLTAHGTSKIGRREGLDPWGEYWRFTAQSMQRMFQDIFSRANIRIQAVGNVLTAIAFLEGLAAQELSTEELDYCDPAYEVLVTVRAEKL